MWLPHLHPVMAQRVHLQRWPPPSTPVSSFSPVSLVLLLVISTHAHLSPIPRQPWPAAASRTCRGREHGWRTTSHTVKMKDTFKPCGLTLQTSFILHLPPFVPPSLAPERHASHRRVHNYDCQPAVHNTEAVARQRTLTIPSQWPDNSSKADSVSSQRQWTTLFLFQISKL